MKRLKVAQLGVGHDHAGDVMTTLRRFSDIYDVVGYAIVPEDSLNLPQFTYEGKRECYDGIKRLTVDELLCIDGLDAVFVETEDRALTKYALLAAKKGLNIHMDKPGGIAEEEFEELIDTVEANGAVFHVGYMYRYNPAVVKLKKDIADGKLGKILSVEAQMNCSHKFEKRNWLRDYPGGMLYFLGCHLIDLVYSIMGEPCEVIPLSCSSHVDGTTADDFGMAVFRYENGVSFARSTAIEVGGYERRQLVVIGTKGTVELKPLERFVPNRPDIFVPLTTVVRERFSEGWYDRGNEYTTEPFGRYDAMLTAFAKYVCGEEECPTTPEYERKLHRLILRACGAGDTKAK